MLPTIIEVVAKLLQIPSTPDPATVERCAFLLAREQEHKPWMKELATLKTELRKYCESQPADQPVRLAGHNRFLDFTPREMERKITDKWKAFNALKAVMGMVKLVASLTITFKVLDLEIPADEQAKFVTTARTGPRDISGGLFESPEAPEAPAIAA
jgi:hypothetical protein